MSRFKNKPIKRHPALAPLSRDHYDELLQAQRLKKGAKGTDKQRRKALEEFFNINDKQPMDQHFADEQRLLLALMKKEDVNKMLSEHKLLLEMAAQANRQRQNETVDSEWMEKFGTALDSHIRWEERTLFPTIQETSSEEQLEQLRAQTELIENSRNRCSPRTSEGKVLTCRRSTAK